MQKKSGTTLYPLAFSELDGGPVFKLVRRLSLQGFHLVFLAMAAATIVAPPVRAVQALLVGITVSGSHSIPDSSSISAYSRASSIGLTWVSPITGLIV
jgi:hypothetical protein